MKCDTIQIVSFNNPYPPNYGGVIDVFFKIKHLHLLNVEIHLHIYTNDRFDISQMQPYCKAIYIYKRNTSFLNFLSKTPYNVKSRFSSELYHNLEKIDAPVIFEGLQSTQVLINHKLSNKVIVRAHNVEHQYYFGLAKNSANIFKKLVYLIEGYKLKHYERILNSVDAIFALSHKEFNYFKSAYKTPAYYVPVFHGNEAVLNLPGFGDYALYHGDLSVNDNVESAKFLVSVFSKLKYKFFIAGSVLPQSLQLLIDRYENVQFKHIEKEKLSMDELISNAHINVLYSNQATGTKLKVFYALYKGRHCIVNKNIVDDEQILSICGIANTTDEFRIAVENAFKLPFEKTQKRKKILKQFMPDESAKQLISILSEME